MKKILLVFILFLILIISSCGEPEYCDVFNHQEPSFILVSLLDDTTKDNLVFGSNSSLGIDEIEVQIKMEDSTYISRSIDGVLNNEDSVLLIPLIENSFSPDLVFSVTNQVIINYNNQFPSDTINIDYVQGDCENFGAVSYDYNLTLNTGDICALCYKEVIEILK